MISKDVRKNETYKRAKLVIEKTYVWTTKFLQKLDRVIEKVNKIYIINDINLN